MAVGTRSSRLPTTVATRAGFVSDGPGLQEDIKVLLG